MEEKLQKLIEKYNSCGKFVLEVSTVVNDLKGLIPAEELAEQKPPTEEE